LIAGSGLGGRLFTLGADNFVQVVLPDNASGLIYTNDGKLGLDGADLELGLIAIASGDAAVAFAAVALSSGIAAVDFSQTALLSGNLGLADALTAQQISNSALVSGQEAQIIWRCLVLFFNAVSPFFW